MSQGGGDEEAEKSFEPTQKRLDDARRRGEVAQSADLVTAASYGGLVLAAWAFGAGSLLALGGRFETLLAQAAPFADQAFGGDARPLWGAVLGGTALLVLPWVLGPAILALLASLAQGSLVVAPERLRPRLSRLSPLSQIKQRFGRDGLIEFLKGLLKVLLYGTVLGLTLARATPDLVGLVRATPAQATAVLLGLTLGLLLQVTLVAAGLGLADLVWQRLAFRRRQMMTRREVTEEMKESEGDPHMKQVRRQKGVDLATRQMLAEVPKASVVLVNPTHYAVALRWDRATGGAPVLVAKGVDEVAARIRERAMAAGIPVRRDPPTARAIYASVEIGQEVLRPEWRAVAAAIRFAERMRARAAKVAR